MGEHQPKLNAAIELCEEYSHYVDNWPVTREIRNSRPGLLEAWLVLTSVKYHGNLFILITLNQLLVLTRLRATGPRPLNSDVLDLRAGGMMHCYPWLELLGFCPPLDQFNGIQWK